MADEETPPQENPPQEPAAEDGEAKDKLGGLLGKTGASKWSKLKASVVTEPQKPRQTEAFIRLVAQKAVAEGVDIPFSEALRKQEVSTRRVSTMKFAGGKAAYAEYKTPNAPTEKALMMARTKKERPYVRGAADRSNKGMTFTKDPYAHLRTQNAPEGCFFVSPPKDRSQSASPNRMGGTSLPSMKSRHESTMASIMAARGSEGSPPNLEFLKTPPGRWRPTDRVPSIIKNNGNWCASWKFTRINSGYKQPQTLSMSPLPQRDPRVMEALAARMGGGSRSVSPYKQAQHFVSPGRNFNPMSPNKHRLAPLRSPEPDSRQSRQQDR
jgi:hypothetical protein